MLVELVVVQRQAALAHAVAVDDPRRIEREAFLHIRVGVLVAAEIDQRRGRSHRGEQSRPGDQRRGGARANSNPSPTHLVTPQPNRARSAPAEHPYTRRASGRKGQR